MTDLNIYSKEQIDELLNAKVNSSSLATVATSGSYNDLTNKPSLASVATSGSYNDLTNTPIIPSGTELVPAGGTDGQVLTKVSGTPAWANAVSGVTNWTKCYTGSQSNPTYNFSDVRYIGQAIYNTLGLNTDGVYLVYLETVSSIISNESIYGVWGIMDDDILNVIGIWDDYNAQKDTYILLGGRIGGNTSGTVPGSINKLVFFNTSTSALSVVTISGTFNVFAKFIGEDSI